MMITAQANIFASLCIVDCWIKRFKSSQMRRVLGLFCASEGAALWEWRRAPLLFYTVVEAWRHRRWTVSKLCEECLLARFPSELSTTLSNFLFFCLKWISPSHWTHFLLFPPSIFHSVSALRVSFLRLHKVSALILETITIIYLVYIKRPNNIFQRVQKLLLCLVFWSRIDAVVGYRFIYIFKSFLLCFVVEVHAFLNHYTC